MIDQTEILRAKILIVDDQESNVILLEQLLKKAGYQYVTSTMDPREVCSLHLEHGFDLILLDLQMPEMDGFQVMEGIKEIEEYGYSPVLVITAQPDHKLRALKAGAKDFITKPIEAVEFQTRVKNMLEVRLLYKQLEDYSEKLEMTVIERTAQLSASEARFKNFTELTSDWYWEQDEQGKFTTVSGPVFEMLGLESEGGGDLSQARWNESELANLKYNIATRRPFLDFVYTLKKADGKEQHLQVSGEPMFDSNCRFIGYRGVGVEISDQHYAYRKESNFRKAIDVIGLGVCLIDRATLAVLDVNETMCTLSGHTRSELLMTTLLQLNIGTEEQLKLTFETVISSGAGVQLREQICCGDGVHRDVLIDFHAFRDDAHWVMVAAFNFSARTV